MLKTILNHPVLHLLVGCILLYTCGVEIIRDIESAEQAEIGAHHGVALYALLHILTTLPEVYKGLSHVSESRNANL